MQADSRQPLFELKNSRLQYQDKVVLDNLSLSIAEGERVAILGGSGAGKSTLLKALREQLPDPGGLVSTTAGAGAHVKCLPQYLYGRSAPPLFLYNLGNLIKPLPAARQEVAAIAGSIGLEKQLYHSVDKLSGGQQQRTSIGRALIQQRDIFMGDEPVASVDDFQAETLLQLICQRHQTVVLAMHDRDQALQFCTRIIGLRDGAIVLDAASDQLSTGDLASLYDAA